MHYILQRLKERSTYAVIFTILLNVTGYSIVPELQDIITNLSLSILSFVGFFTKEVN